MNPTIPLQVRVPQFTDPLTAAKEGLGLRQLGQATDIQRQVMDENSQKLQALKEDREDDQKFQQAFVQNQGDWDKALTDAGKQGVRARNMMRYQQENLKNKQAILVQSRDQRIENESKRDQYAAALMGVHMAPDDQKQAMWDQARQTIAQAGLPTDIFTPQVPDDKTLQAHIALMNHAGDLYKYAAEEESANKRREDAAKSKIEAAAKQRADQEKEKQQVREDIARQHVGVTDQAGHDQFLVDIANQYPEQAQEYSNLTTYSPATAAAIQDRAMTADQRAKANKEPTERNPTEASLAQVVARGKMTGATPEDITAGQAAELALKRLDESKRSSRPVTNVYTPAPQPVGADNKPRTATIDDVPANLRPQVQQVLDYRMPEPPSSRNNPTNQAIRDWVAKVDQTYDGTMFPSRNKLRSAFTSGKQADNITSLNTLIGHLGSLDDAIGVLDNSKLRKYNTVANYLASETGSPKLKPFITSRLAVEEELARAFKGGVASEGEVKQWDDAINQADSPEALHKAVLSIVDIMESRTKALDGQYTDGMGKPPDKPFIREKSQQVLDRLRSKSTGDLPRGSGKAIDKTTAIQFYNAAGKDPKKAQKMAEDYGWKVQ